MTDNEKRDETGNGVIIPYHATENFVEIAENEPTLDVQYLPPPPQPSTRPNLQSGMSAYCLDAIVQNQDLMDARERIRKNREEGERAEGGDLFVFIIIHFCNFPFLHLFSYLCGAP